MENISGAIISHNKIYRYQLFRIWNTYRSKVLFIMLNPSTADENSDDPTIRRCIGFAKDWGYGGIYVCNLYALRSTDPKGLKVKEANIIDIRGPENTKHILETVKICTETVFAWGASDPNLKYHRRAYVNKLISLIPNPKCLGKTKTGEPKHPLYLKKDSQRINFQPPNQ